MKNQGGSDSIGGPKQYEFPNKTAGVYIPYLFNKL